MAIHCRRDGLNPDVSKLRLHLMIAGAKSFIVLVLGGRQARQELQRSREGIILFSPKLNYPLLNLLILSLSHKMDLVGQYAPTH